MILFKYERKMLFVSSRAWDKEKFWVPMRNRASDRRIPRSDALPLSHRDSTVSEVYYEVHMRRVLHTARISHFDLNRIREMVSFELNKEMLSAFRSPLKVQFVRKTYVTIVVAPGTSWSFQDVIKVQENDKFSSTQEVWSNPWGPAK